MFTAAVNGRAMRWAFMPPYLNTLTFSERDLAARSGWALTQQAIGEMQDVSRGIGATFVVMFLPFKSQVYLPWLAQSQAAPASCRAICSSTCPTTRARPTSRRCSATGSRRTG